MTANPSAMMKLVAAHLPMDLREHVLLVGSLAAAYHYRTIISQEVTTKDADVIIQPAGALDACREIATRLLSLGWQHRSDLERPPGAHALASNLPAVRLYPPTTQAYFVELLAMPPKGQATAVHWQSIELPSGWYGVPSFRFMALLEMNQQLSAEGVRYASPMMMALANALSHERIGTARMTGALGGRSILRSAKDLGRVLGIARLEDRAALEAWPEQWLQALKACFSSEWTQLAACTGDGIRQLLTRDDALEQAHHALDYGLLKGQGLTPDNLRAVGEQFIADVLEPFELLSQKD